MLHMRIATLAPALFVLLFSIGYGLRFLRLLQNTALLNAASSSFSRDYYVGSPGNPPLSYVVLGDSTVQGTGAPTLQDSLPYTVANMLAEQGRYVHVTNLAVSGAEMADVASRQLPQIGSTNPDVVTLNCGANDATHFTPTASFQASLQTILISLNNGSRTVYVADTPDVSRIPALPIIYSGLAGRRAAMQNGILSTLLTDRHIVMIDLYAQGALTRSDQYASDRFHPSPAGYAVWANLYARAIAATQK